MTNEEEFEAFFPIYMYSHIIFAPPHTPNLRDHDLNNFESPL